MQDAISFLLSIVMDSAVGIIGIMLTTIFYRIRKWLKFRTFVKVFGRVAENPKNLIISIPLWKVNEADRSVKRYTKIGLDHREEEFHGPNEMVSFEDHEAGTFIEHIIAEFHGKPVQYILDNEEFDTTNKTVIMIGSPIANTRARCIFDLDPPPYFECILEAETAEHPAVVTIRDKVRETTFDSAGKKEYSMILRIRNPQAEDGYYFFVFGAHGNGTLRAAQHLKNNWKEFRDAKPAAGVLLEMTRHSDVYHELLMNKHGFSGNQTIDLPILPQNEE